MRSDGLLAPTVGLGVMFLIGNIGWAVAAAYSLSLRPAFLMLYFFGVPWALAWWVLANCRTRRVPTSIDHGWFVFSTWPIAVPYHLLRTRGGRGCLVMIGMVGMFVLSYGVALGVFFVLTR